MENGSKKRVLFVDDEPLVLQGLQRMLRHMREEWEMEFVDSGPKALEAMASNPFAVIVSDMRMPGMNGAHLLNEVMKRYPKTVRLILSGHADQDLIMKCVGSTHQYLTKPCEPEALKTTVRRASALAGSLQNEKLLRLISQMDRLPSIPALYVEVMEKLQRPEVSLEEVGTVIGRDIAMTAKILKLVNSAFFGLRRQISNVTEAVCYLGLDTIKSLVLSIHVFSQFEGKKPETLPLDGLWDHSLQTAGGAKLISKLENCPQKIVDESFSSGMLHDAGKLILAFNFPKEYGQALAESKSQAISSLEIERRAFGATHAEIGGYLLGLWGLPVPVVEAIALHHDPALSTIKTFSPLTAVHAADALTTPKIKARAEHAALDLNYLSEIGLADRVKIWQDALSTLTPEQTT